MIIYVPQRNRRDRTHGTDVAVLCKSVCSVTAKQKLPKTDLEKMLSSVADIMIILEPSPICLYFK